MSGPINFDVLEQKRDTWTMPEIWQNWCMYRWFNLHDECYDWEGESRMFVLSGCFWEPEE